MRQNNYKTKAIIKDKEGHYIILRGVLQQENITIVNIHTPNIGASKYIKKILEYFKKEIESNSVIVVDFATPLSTMDQSSRQKINKDMAALNYTLDQMDLIFTEHFIPKKQNIHSSEMYMYHFQR